MAARPRRADAPRPRRRRRARRRRRRRHRPTSATCAPGCARCACARWIASVNGERLFLKGSNHGPTRMALAEATPEELRARRRAGVRRRPRPAADPRPHHPARALRRGRRGRPAPLAGPARCSGATPAASASRRCARPRRRSTCSATTRRSRSGAATTSRWRSTCDPATRGDPKALRRLAVTAAAAQELPDVEQDGARPLGEAGAARRPTAPARSSPTPACSPTRPSSTAPTATSTSAGTTATSATSPGSSGRCPAWPASSREFGAQAVPGERRLLRAGALARPRLGAARSHPRAASERCSTGTCRPADHADLRRRGTPPPRRYQAARRPAPHRGAAPAQVPADRRVRPVLLRRRPPRGHVVGARPRPGARRPAYDALREACRPVIVVADRLPEPVTAGEALALDVHVVSDLRAQVDDAEVTAALAWTGGSRTWRWRGDIPADGCQRVGTMQVVVPDAPGPLALELRLPRTTASTVDNRYEADDRPADSRRIREVRSRFGRDGDDDRTTPTDARPHRSTPARPAARRGRCEFYRSAVGKKWVMAITGLAAHRLRVLPRRRQPEGVPGRRGLQPLRRVPPRAPRAAPPPHRGSCGSCGSG